MIIPRLLLLVCSVDLIKIDHIGNNRATASNFGFFKELQQVVR